MTTKNSCIAHLQDVIHDFHPESSTPFGSVLVTPYYDATETCAHCSASPRWVVGPDTT